MYRIMLVDDEITIRGGMKAVIPWHEVESKVVCEASNGQEALDRIEEYMPNIVITDVVMPIMDGIELTKGTVE